MITPKHGQKEGRDREKKEREGGEVMGRAGEGYRPSDPKHGREGEKSKRASGHRNRGPLQGREGR